MEALAKWLESERNRRFPNVAFAIGMLGWMPCMVMGPATMTFGMGHDYQGATLQLLVFGIIAVLGWAPFLYLLWQNRHRPNLNSLAVARRRGHLAEAIGPHADRLAEAARELEQIALLAGQASLPDGLGRELGREGRRRMSRALDLCIGAPALYGLTTSQAEVQILDDCGWLSRTRQGLESIGRPIADDLQIDPLARLQALAAERDAAVAELNA